MTDPSEFARLVETSLAERWRAPAAFNIGEICDRWPAARPAVIVAPGGREAFRVTFGELSVDASRLANILAARGIVPGDRVAILLPQGVETVVAHLAVYKLGAIALPLSVLFGPQALRDRLEHAAPALVIGETEALERVQVLDLDLDAIDVDRDWSRLLSKASASFSPARTYSDSPALLIYTSGTTGPPKGALHAHRVLIGHLPGFELSHGGFPQPGDLIWTPADWAWIGGLYDVVMPALYHGVPVLTTGPGRFDPEHAFTMIKRCGVRNAFIPPTALRLMRECSADRVRLRSIASGGEAVDEPLLEWSRDRLGAPVHEFYGQTEANYVVGNCERGWPIRPGRMGRPYPGHDVRVVDSEIVVRADDDPVVFLGYWNDPRATAEKVRDGWLRTGDLAQRDDDGYFRFLGRKDDVIISAGYRIGPVEIEECLMRDPRVARAAVVGAPDAVRGEVVKAYVVPARGVVASANLADELRDHVRTQLAAYEYPRQIEFVDELPLTVTGKVRRSVLRQRAARGGPAAEGTETVP